MEVALGYGLFAELVLRQIITEVVIRCLYRQLGGICSRKLGMDIGSKCT